MYILTVSRPVRVTHRKRKSHQKHNDYSIHKNTDSRCRFNIHINSTLPTNILRKSSGIKRNYSTTLPLIKEVRNSVLHHIPSIPIYFSWYIRVTVKFVPPDTWAMCSKMGNTAATTNDSGRLIKQLSAQSLFYFDSLFFACVTNKCL